MTVIDRLARAFVRHLAFPLQERLKRHTTLAALASLNKSQWDSAETIDRQRDRDLADLLTQVAEHVPYYREKLGHIPADALREDPKAALATLPPLDKAMIREAGEALRSDDATDLIRSNTGGSTGQPLVFYLTRERVSHDVAAKLRSFEWWGVTFGDREAVVWGAPHELSAQDRIRNLRDWLFRSQLIPAFDMGDTGMDTALRSLRRLRPRIVFGYPTAIAALAARAEQRGLALDDLGTRVVFCTAEQLYPHQRERIEAAFGCPVANGYGARDAGFIAHQCPKGSLHITAEDLIVEILGEDGTALPAGETGEIVVTHLRNRGYPLLRYRTGDRGSLSPTPCACGRGLPVLANVEGRTTDFVVTADGRRVHALALIYVIRDLPAVQEFKVLQKRADLTEVTLIADADAQAAVRETIERGFKAVLGSDVTITITFVDRIPRDPNGKYRYVRSELTS